MPNLTIVQAIAVNPEMHYTVMQDQQHPDAGVVVFATARSEQLRGILESMGLKHSITKLQGKCSFSITLTSCSCRCRF